MVKHQLISPGSAYALSAFALWGITPFYFKAVAHVPAWEILACRAIFAACFLVPLLLFLPINTPLLTSLRRPKTLLSLLAATLCIATNWIIFIWSVANDRLLEASLGYFIIPLVSIALGAVCLAETLSRLQWLGTALVSLGIILQLLLLNSLPWLALLLALSFGLYGLLHKTLPLSTVHALMLETLLMLPIAAGYLYWLDTQQQGMVLWTVQDWSLLLMAGPVTAIPLLLFTAATKRLSLTHLGFFQYIVPSCLFVLAVFIYHEPFHLVKLLSFVCIWLALILISIDAVHRSKHPALVSTGIQDTMPP